MNYFESRKLWKKLAKKNPEVEKEVEEILRRSLIFKIKGAGYTIISAPFSLVAFFWNIVATLAEKAEEAVYTIFGPIHRRFDKTVDKHNEKIDPLLESVRLKIGLEKNETLYNYVNDIKTERKK